MLMLGVVRDVDVVVTDDFSIYVDASVDVVEGFGVGVVAVDVDTNVDVYV